MSWRTDVTTETLTAAKILPGMRLLLRDRFRRVRLVTVVKLDPMRGGATMLWCTEGFHLQCPDDTDLVTVI